MGHSNSLYLMVRTESVEIRPPHLDARSRRTNEMGHPALEACFSQDFATVTKYWEPDLDP